MNHNINIDNFIERLISGINYKSGQKIDIEEKEIYFLINNSLEIFKKENSLIRISSPLNIIGDIHGQYYDLLRIFNFIGYPNDNNYLFLGDYVDRGLQSIETICLWLAFKIKYPNKIYLLRGNHEIELINRSYGFYDECKRRFNIKIWKEFNKLFNYFSISALVEDKIFCMHGGLSPFLTNFSQIEILNKPINIINKGISCDLLWSDPNKEINGWKESERLISFEFGIDVIKMFNKSLDIDLICRAHQVVEDGYEFIADRSLLTIFSAPNYCNEFDNSSGIWCINKDLLCKFKILKPIVN